MLKVLLRNQAFITAYLQEIVRELHAGDPKKDFEKTIKNLKDLIDDNYKVLLSEVERQR